jgi:pimeloyl-ACP methyl ester carboxylesterase
MSAAITLRSSVAGLATAALAITALSACTPDSNTGPEHASGALLPRSSSTVEEPSSGPWSRVVTGETGPGSLYAIHVPRSWNGNLVTIAHGFRDVATPVDLRDQDGLYATRDALGAQGFAVAYSSYSENGFAVKDGAQRTHQLRGLAQQHLPTPPHRNYLIGYSLGGGIVVSLAEQFPGVYDGALTVCGMNGGSLVQTQFLGHVRALFDGYFPGALPGSAIGLGGATVTPAQMQAAVLGAVFTDPLGTAKVAAIASTAQAPLEFSNQNQLFESLITALTFHARGVDNIVALAHGKTPFGNHNTVYAAGASPLLPLATLTQLLALANATAPRFAIDPSAQNYLAKYFTPSGVLHIPLVTVHNRWDPAVPARHESVLAEKVAAAGYAENLSQRLHPSYGHCVLPVGYVQQAFSDLAMWVETGVKP